MSARDQHRLARSVRRLAVDLVRDTDRRKTGKALNGAGEREEQFQIAIHGTASDYPAWTTIELPFDTDFTIATGRRESALLRPQVTCGYELTGVERLAEDPLQGYVAVEEAVILNAVVRRYVFNANHVIKSAVVNIGAIAPGDELRFRGFVHMTFQGYGAPGDDQPDEAG